MNFVKNILLLVLTAQTLAVNQNVIERQIHQRMHISEQQLHRIGEKKKLLEEIEEAKITTEDPETVEIENDKDPNVPHEPSEFEPHNEEEDVIEGDEILTEEEVDEMLNKALQKSNRVKRQFQTHQWRMWPTTDVDFYIDRSTIADEIVPMLREGVDWFNKHTCFTFTEATSRDKARKPYLTFSSGAWCQSYIGKITNEEQVIQMIPACATVGTIIHETLHALGFYHEQARSDRDNYVQINIDNVKTKSRGNFAKKTNTTNFQWPYVYGSVMAYPGSAFAINKKKQTIVANDSKYQRSMGHRVIGSFADARRVNAAYRCIDNCTNSNDCQNGGFHNSKNCQQCVCPETFDGAECTQFRARIDPTGSNGNCGGIIEIGPNSEQRHVLKAASGGQNKAHYCSTMFKAPVGKVLEVRMVKEAKDDMPCSDGCNWGYVELNSGVDVGDGRRDFGLPGYRDCCVTQIETGQIKTDSDILLATAFARTRNTQLTLYVTAVDGRRQKTDTSAATTTTTSSSSTVEQRTSDGCVRKRRYNFVDKQARDGARKCANGCLTQKSLKGYKWYYNCYYCCWDKYSS